jgi:hypothetical protein
MMTWREELSKLGKEKTKTKTKTKMMSPEQNKLIWKKK